jgi:hypothetical protein
MWYKTFLSIIINFSFITIIIILIKLRFYKDDDNIIQNVWYKNINRLRIIGKEIQNLSLQIIIKRRRCRKNIRRRKT